MKNLVKKGKNRIDRNFHIDRIRTFSKALHYVPLYSRLQPLTDASLYVARGLATVDDRRALSPRGLSYDQKAI